MANGPACAPRLAGRPLDSLRAATRRAGELLPVDGKKNTYNGNNVLPLLRKQFTAKKNVRQATLFIGGLGQFEAVLNGQKIGDHFLEPGWTKYDKQAQYVAFDLTSHVRHGANALGVLLGNGFYYVPPVKERHRKLKTAFGYPKLICRLAIEYQDSPRQDVVSDLSWRTAAGPITFSSIYLQRRRLQHHAGTSWLGNAEIQRPCLAAGHHGRRPIRAAGAAAGTTASFQHFSPQNVTQPQPGKWVYDFGQNASGIVELQVRGHRGDTVRMAPAKPLGVDKLVSQKNSGRPYYFTYVLKGNGLETWRPRFSYYGFRYAQLTGGVPQGQANPSG